MGALKSLHIFLE